MRIYFDTEFIEDGRTIDLINIGMIRDDGATLYLENADCDLSRASQWVVENVIPHLRGGRYLLSRTNIAQEIKRFSGTKPEFWAYFAAYDWVALCQLYGRMIDLPKGWPMFCRDVQQVKSEKGIVDVPAQMTGEHDAMADALYVRDLHTYLLNR